MSIPLSLLVLGSGVPAENVKTDGALYPAKLLQQARENADRYPWAAGIRKQIVDAAQPWMKLSDEELWNLMFGNTIKRSWMVWSNGYCPSCKEGVPMYGWIHQPLEQPWKVRCPHCKELFPKNDFHKFYLSGLDEHRVFDPKRAVRSLLFSAEHPDPSDPLRMFGVDDGEGYVEGDKRWRFIGAYLIYGQWKKAIVAGITSLSAAYAITGDKAYSHKAGVLLDRVADLYPTFDFGREGVMYEGPPLTGYVSTWHDACGEVRDLAVAYDQAFLGMKDDPELVAFLADKAKHYKIENPKSSFADIQRNIEDRILHDTVINRRKIQSNYPQTDLTVATIKTVLGWPGNREEVMGLLGDIIGKSTAVDGLTGEKGLTGYTSFSPMSLGQTLGLYSRVDDGFLRDALKRYPRIHDGYRFHIDTWCFGDYYPFSGDCGRFAQQAKSYAGLIFTKAPGFGASMYTFLWQLFEITGDPALVQVLYKMNGQTLDGLPHDLFATDPPTFQAGVEDVIRKHGVEPKVGSVNKQEWHIAVLRSGKGAHQRAMWLDYDSGGPHGHMDGMNLGMFAKGLDMMPDFGYPPVQYGGWGSPRSRWYTMATAHNTVVIDGANQQTAAGKTTLWADGDGFRAIRASAPGLYAGCSQYERTAAMVDISDRDSYVIDIFRVVGGKEHTKLQHSHFGTITARGLALSKSEAPALPGEMRSFAIDESPTPGWSVDWKIDDRNKYLKPGADIRLRYTDLTSEAEALTCEKWISPGMFSSNDEAWIPCVLTRRRSEQEPLSSTFVSVVEPSQGRGSIKNIRRLPIESAGGTPYPDSCVALEITLDDGRRDIFLSADVENPLHTKPAFTSQSVLVQRDLELRLAGQMCLVRLAPDGRPVRIAVCQGKSVTVGGTGITLRHDTDFAEVSLDGGRLRVLSGPKDVVEAVKRAR